MVRMGAAIIALEVAALVVAYLAFDLIALLVGAPVLMVTGLVLLVVIASEAPRRRLREQRATRFDPQAPQPGGLMSGFFEVPRARTATDGSPAPGAPTRR
ncbi:MAG TPA: hypothetical protein VEZ42_22270 [Pseudonocardia sp.]|nr:hypothetical protein [Pseudonocardia sp.]